MHQRVKIFSLQEGLPKGLVMYFHGNSRSIKRHNHHVIMIDYRGFGKSIGRRSEKAFKKDAQFVDDQLKVDYSESRIIVYGCSVGSGFVAKSASANHPRTLIDTPYYGMSRAAKRYLTGVIGLLLKKLYFCLTAVRNFLQMQEGLCPLKR